MPALRRTTSSLPRSFAALLFLTSIPNSTCSPQVPSNASACRLPTVPNVYLSVGHGLSTLDLGCVSGVGVTKSFTLFVDFADAPAGNESTQGLYDFFFPAASVWYETSSYGNLALDAQADVSQFFRMPRPAADYAWNRGITYEQHEAYIQDALAAYAAAKGGDVPVVDTLYVVAGRNAPAITYSPTFMGSVSTRGGARVASKAVTIGQDAYTRWGFKVVNHETGHAMCLADLYPASGAVGLYVGEYDIMGNIDALSADYFAWDKWRLGWLGDGQVVCLEGGGGGTHTVYPLERADGEVKSVVLKKDETKALVLEVRAGGGVDDEGFKPGVVVYTVDTTVETLQGPIRVLTAEPLPVQGEIDVPDWGVKVSVLEQQGEAYVVSIQ